MGNSEEGKSAKPEKSSPPAMDQSNANVYPDWAAMQAYYGPRVAMPQYVVASGHAPHHYMWPPQPMMPPYGAPYPAIYAHGGVYAHPGVPLAAAPVSVETSGKSSGNSDKGFVNKLKSFDGLTMSIGNGNGNPDGAEGGADGELSQSGEAEGSSDGSNGNTSEAGANVRKRSREESPIAAGEEKTRTRSCAVPSREMNGSSDKAVGVAVAPPKAGETVMGTNMTAALELRNPPPPTNVTQPCQQVSNESWLQNDRELKRERRKQSNRESARRSRLRKQAEAEELAMRVQSLTAENMTLKSEINKLMENSDKLKQQNAVLVEKLKKELGETDGRSVKKIDDDRMQPVGTADLLARVHSSGPSDNHRGESDEYENRSSGTKLRQLLDASPRTADAVVAG